MPVEVPLERRVRPRCTAARRCEWRGKGPDGKCLRQPGL